jgi:hypothetical protein
MASMIVCALIALPWRATAGGSTVGDWHLLEPQRDAASLAREQRSPDGRMVPLARTLADATLTERLRAVLATGAPAILPALDRAARKASRRAIDCPAWRSGIAIYLSDEDGGFARKDLFVGVPDQPALCADYFVDLTVDDASLANGEWEEVLTHEFGHVFLRRLLGPVPPTPTRNPHSVFAITDPVTAFDEGFGISLQPLAARLTATPGFRQRAEGTAAASPADFWLSRRETRLRESAVPHGDFAFEALPPAADMHGIERWRAAETALPDDRCHLKSGDAMMASEGVAATFLYRLLDGGRDRAALAGRYEQLATVLAHLGRWPQDTPPLIALVRAWGERYPQERQQVTRLFLETTYGATSSAAVRRQAQSLSCLGATGSLQAFLPALKAYRATMDRLVDAVTAGRAALDGALHRPLWLADPSIRIPAQLWAKRSTLPLVVDLNTADESALEWLFAGNRALAQAIVAERRKKGFDSLDDAIARVDMSAAQRSRLRQLAAGYPSLPPFVRE